MNFEKELPIHTLLPHAVYSMPDAVIIFDMEWKCVFINKEFTNLFGIEKAEILNKHFTEIPGVEDQNIEEAKKFKILAKSATLNERIGPVDLSIVARSGKRVPVSLIGTVLKDDEGTPTHVIAVIRDITNHKRMEEEMKEHREHLEDMVKRRTAQLVKKNEKLKKEIAHRKQMENELIKTERKYKNLFETAPDSIFIINLNGVVTSCNLKTVEMSGYTKDHIVGRHFSELDFLPSKNLPEYKKVFSQARRGKIVEPFEIVIIQKDGTILFADIRFSPLRQNGELVGFLAISRDITEQKKAQKKLEESETRYRSLVEQSIQGLIVIKNLQIIYANPAFSRISGYSREELLLFSLDDIKNLLHPEDREYAWNHLQQRLEEEVLSQYEFRIIRKDGEVRWVQIHASNIQYGGEPAVQTAIMDITELKRAKIKLKEYSKELEKMVEKRTEKLRNAQAELVRKERLAMLGQLAGSVGHELRNPLGVISNSAYFLRMRSKDDDEKIQKHLDIIERSIKKADKIISDLLNFSRIKEPIRTSSNINHIIKDALDRIKIPEDIIVNTDLDESIPNIQVDPDQIQQVSSNIINNAIQAMPEGGKLKIKTVSDKDHIFIVVKDTGEGIPKEHIENIMKPLFTTRKKGIGLGLAIVKSIIDGHNGDIDIESTKGKGTKITIKLPFQD